MSNVYADWFIERNDGDTTAAMTEGAQWCALKDTKHLVIYHAISKGVACDDGFGAYTVAFNKLAEYDTYVLGYEGIYGKVPVYDLIDEYTEVHILDFSYPVDILNVIAARAKQVILLDHHKSAMERWEVERGQYAFNDRDIIEFDMNRSGAKMAWDFYNNPRDQVKFKEAPKMIQYIEDNDLWRFALPNTKEYIGALRSYPQTLVKWNQLIDRTDINLDGMIAEGKIIDRYYNQKLQETIATGKELINIRGKEGLCCNAPKMFASDIGHILAKESGTYGATYFKKNDGTEEWSLRSIGDYDVSAIAKEFGGGGHKNAAGFSLSTDEGISLHDK